jgi:hypothetical protein
MKHRMEIAVASHSSQSHMSAENLKRMQEYRMRQAAGLPNGYNPNAVGVSPSQRVTAVK